MITFFQRNIHWSSLFARKARANTERLPPGHPIILLKSNNFNVVAVSVKRSIDTNALRTGITFLTCAARNVTKRVNAAAFWRVVFRSGPQKGFTPKNKPSDKFDHNFNELYVDSDKPNDFQCIKLRSVQMIWFLVRKSEIVKMVPPKCKKLSIRKNKTPANLKFIRKIKLLQA